MPLLPAVQPVGTLAAKRAALVRQAPENCTMSPALSSGEEFYDAEEVVPRGVRAAVQMFEVCARARAWAGAVTDFSGELWPCCGTSSSGVDFLGRMCFRPDLLLTVYT